MKQRIIIVLIFLILILLIMGCARGGYNYPSGQQPYQNYPQYNNPQQQGYIGGGCSV